MPLKVSKKDLVLYVKGFSMGTADVVPGVSGGTVALITGVYDELVKTIGSFDHHFFKILLTFDLKKIATAMNLKFLMPLGLGIASSIIIMARIMHYLIDNYSIQTWSLFFGLILASIVFILKTVKDLKSVKNIFSILLGTGLGLSVVSLVPVQTPESYLAVFIAGLIGICAMILPGISGSFILLILGKYYFITSMLKNPFASNHLVYIGVFCLGCLIGLLSFSKVINFLLEKYHSTTMCVLIGFMIGSLKKIWPWRNIEDAKIINGKLKILSESIYFPATIDTQVITAIFIMALGFSMVYIIEKASQTNN